MNTFLKSYNHIKKDLPDKCRKSFLIIPVFGRIDLTYI